MTHTVASFIDTLASIAPFSKAAGWDPVGLQIGDPDAPVERVAVCHEVTAAVVAALEAEPVDLVITYHPLLFRPTTRLVAGPGPGGRALSLARTGTSLAVVHTAFDVAKGGCADALAEALSLNVVGLRDVRGFAPLWPGDTVKIVTFAPGGAIDALGAAMTAAGAGAIGGYSGCSFRSSGSGTFTAGVGTAPVVGTVGAAEIVDEVRLEMVAPSGRVDAVVGALVAAHPYEEPPFDVYERKGNAGMLGRVGSIAPQPLGVLARKVATSLGGVVRFAGDPEAQMTRVSCSPGSGGSVIPDIPGGTDVFIAGDISHHQARAALERGVAIIDPGHAATERPGVEKLYAAVAEIVADAVDLTRLDADPWKGL